MDTSTQFINLLYGKPGPGLLQALFTPDALASILISQNPILMSNIQKQIIRIIHQVASDDLPNQQKKLCIDQALCYLTQFGLSDKQCFSIPTYNHHKQSWESISYQIKRIPLTPKWLPTVDQYHAVLFTAKAHQPILVMMGTTYPTNQGFWSTIIADLFPFMSIGGLLSTYGASIVSATIKQHQNIKLIGQSLGGALALSFAQKDTETTLINPALPYTVNNTPQNVTMLHNQHDWISRHGSMPKNSKVIIANSPYNKRHPILDHIQSRLQDSSCHLTASSFDHIQSNLLIRTIIYWPLRLVGFLIVLPIYLFRLAIAYFLQIMM